MEIAAIFQKFPFFLGHPVSLDYIESLFKRHIEARWLTLVPALERMMKLFTQTEPYFLDFLPVQEESEKTLPKNKRCKRIKEHLQNKKEITVQITFLVEFSPMMNQFLLQFQAEGPMVHLLYAELKNILLKVSRRFIKADKVNSLTGVKLQRLNVQDTDLQLSLEQMFVGPKTEEALKELSPERKKAERKKMQDFYIRITKDIFRRNFHWILRC